MIKNLLFDFGGVLMNINYRLTINAFIDLGYPHFENMYSQFKANPLFEHLETGKVSEETFYSAMKAIPQKPPTEEMIKNAWNAMLIGFRKETLDFLPRLTQHYRLFLLSNTNIIHKRAFDQILYETHQLPNVDGFFKKAYYSHLIGLRKPHPEVFQFVLNDAGISAGETLFIEDSINNLQAAAKLGIRGHLVRQGERIEDTLNYLISSKSM